MVGKFLSGKLRFMCYYIVLLLDLEFTAHRLTNSEFEKTWCKNSGKSGNSSHCLLLRPKKSDHHQFTSDKGSCVVSFSSLAVVVWIEREP